MKARVDMLDGRVRLAMALISRGVALGLALCVACGAMLALAGGGAADASYRVSVEKWRADYEATLRSDDGWLTGSGLFWLHGGENRFGSDALGDIVLAGKNIPAQAGTFTLQGGKVVVHARPGAKMTLRGKPVETAELHADVPDERLLMGDVALLLHASGARFGIRLKDKNSKLRRGFSGLHWFPIDESYRVTARYIPDATPKTVQTQNIVGDFDPYIMIGQVEFTLQGKTYRLEASENTPGTGTLFIVFRDLTSGKQTDAAARFLVTDAPKNGAVVVDFNKAYNRHALIPRTPLARCLHSAIACASPSSRARKTIKSRATSQHDASRGLDQKRIPRPSGLGMTTFGTGRTGDVFLLLLRLTHLIGQVGQAPHCRFQALVLAAFEFGAGGG